MSSTPPVCFFSGIAHCVTLNGLEALIWLTGFDTFPKKETKTNLLFQIHKIIVTRNNCIKLINLTSSSVGKFNLTIEKSFKKTFHWRRAEQKFYIDHDY